MKSMYKSDYVEIFFDEEKKLLVQKWNPKFIQFSCLKETVDETVKLFQTLDAEKLLSDTTTQPIIDTKGTDYTSLVIPQLMESGMKKMAFLMAKDFSGDLGAKNFSTVEDAPFIMHFDNIKDANSWILE